MQEELVEEERVARLEDRPEIALSPAASSALAWETWMSRIASSVCVGTRWSSRRGTRSRPGATSPQRDSESHRLSARTSPMNVPSWCQAPGTVGVGLAQRGLVHGDQPAARRGSPRRAPAGRRARRPRASRTRPRRVGGEHAAARLDPGARRVASERRMRRELLVVALGSPPASSRSRSANARSICSAKRERARRGRSGRGRAGSRRAGSRRAAAQGSRRRRRTRGARRRLGSAPSSGSANPRGRRRRPRAPDPGQVPQPQQAPLGVAGPRRRGSPRSAARSRRELLVAAVGSSGAARRSRRRSFRLNATCRHGSRAPDRAGGRADHRAPGATSSTTTALAPICAPAPMRTPPKPWRRCRC